MSKRIICVCSGGFGNRLRPLSSCHKIAKLTGRDLMVWWVKDHRCGVEFNDLFENEFDFVDEEFVDSLKDSAKTYIHSAEAIALGATVTGNHLLLEICNRFVRAHVNTMRRFAVDDQEETLFVFTDNFVGYEDHDRDFLWNLTPVTSISDAVDFHTISLGINSETIGVHARGSDFFVGVNYYIKGMRKVLTERPKAIFYVISDDLDFEQAIRDAFPEDILLIRSRKHYVAKKDKEKSYRRNALISKEAMIDGIIDMYLLARTNIMVGHPNSTFLQICKILSAKGGSPK